MAETQVVIQREDPEIEAYRLGLLKSAKALADQDITLPTYQVAGLSGLQQAALEFAGQGLGSYAPYLEAAGQDLTRSRAIMDPSNLQNYMNPYRDAVSDEINRSFDIQASQANQGAVGAGAFGGSRAAVQQAEIGRNRASALAKAEADAYLQAQQAQQQAAEAAGILGLRSASLGEMGQKLGQQAAGFGFELGAQQQQQQQRVLDAERQSNLAQLYEPYQRLGFLSDIYRGAPTTQQTISSATSPQVSPFQTFAGLGIAGLSAAAGAQKAGLFG